MEKSPKRLELNVNAAAPPTKSFGDSAGYSASSVKVEVRNSEWVTLT